MVPSGALRPARRADGDPRGRWGGMAPPPRDELLGKSVKELKDMLREQGYNPDRVSGIEKEDLVEKLWMLLRCPVPEDEYPLPLYSNCWPQLILRTIFLAAIQLFAFSYLVAWGPNLVILLLATTVLTVRNVVIQRRKAKKLRRRA